MTARRRTSRSRSASTRRDASRPSRGAGAGPEPPAGLDAGAAGAAPEPREPGGLLPSRFVVGSRAVAVGRVQRSFPRSGAALVALEGALAVGDWVAVRGATTDLVQRVERLERDGRAVSGADAGEAIGLAVASRVRPGDRVYRLEGDAS